MPHLTALLHTHNDGLRLGRCLETLYPCDELVIVDHGSRDSTLEVAREYGAKILPAEVGVSRPVFIDSAWIFCLEARESISEALAASLYEWKSAERKGGQACSMFVREETPSGWLENRAAETRLVPSTWQRWNGFLPAHDASASALLGEILRFTLP